MTTFVVVATAEHFFLSFLSHAEIVEVTVVTKGVVILGGGEVETVVTPVGATLLVAAKKLAHY